MLPTLSDAAPERVVHIELDGVPVGKGRPRSRIGYTSERKPFVQVYTDPQTREYEGRLRGAAYDAMAHAKPIEGSVRVEVIAYMPIPKSFTKRKHHEALTGDLRPTTKPDADNILKTLDALNEIVWIDDSQIVESVFTKFYDARPRLEITVTSKLQLARAA